MPQPTPGTVYLTPGGDTVLAAGTTASHVATIPVVVISTAAWARVSVPVGALPDVRVRAPRMGDQGRDERPLRGYAVPVPRRQFAAYRPVGIARPRTTT